MNIEEFVNSYLQKHRHDVLLNPYNGLIDFANTFKEQMLKDALLEWAKGRRAAVAKEVVIQEGVRLGADAAFEELIDKLNEM